MSANKQGKVIEFCCPHCQGVNKMWFRPSQDLNIEHERDCVQCSHPFIVTIAHGLNGRFNAVVTSVTDTDIAP